MKKVFTGLLFLFLFLFRTYGQQTYADFTFDVVCHGNSTLLTSTSTHNAGDSILLYMWDLDGNLTFEIVSSNVTQVTINVDSIQYVGHKIYTQMGLMESIYKMVPVTKTYPAFDWNGHCHGDWTQFIDKSVITFGDIKTYDWYFGDGTTSVEANPVHIFPAAGNYTISLVLSTLNGCWDSISKQITIDPTPVYNPTYSMTPDQIIDGWPHFKFFNGQSLDVNLNTPYTDITWNPSTLSGDHVIIDQSGNYSVRVINEYGCHNDKKFSTEVIDDYTVNPMTVITPYDPSSNYSKFKIKWFIQPNEKYEVKIFNRYGDEVYSSSNYQNDWDGTYKDNVVPEGSYYYYIKAKDGKVYKGAVNVLNN